MIMIQRFHKTFQKNTMKKTMACETSPGALAWLGTDPVPALAYHDPAYFELEREAVFRKTWIQMGHVSEIPEPGSFIVRPFEAAGTSVLITRGKDGEIRAFHNVCTHRGTALVTEQSGMKSRFSCPYHGWTFSNEGDLVSAPDFEKFYTDKSQCSLPKISVDTCGGFIFINLDKSPAESLQSFLGPYGETLETLLPSRATTFSEYVYEIDANWKITYDNFQENYHLRFVHTKTGASALTKENPFAYPSQYSFAGSHRSQTLQKGTPPSQVPPVQGLAFDKASRHDQLPQGKVDCKLFPNLFVVGLSTYVFSHCVMPITHERSRGTIRVYWSGEDDSASRRFAREYMTASLRDVHIEDIAIIERAQKGLSSGALQHIHFQVHESLCRHLFNEVDRRVKGYKADLDSRGESA